MSNDFRTMLQENAREGDLERWFDDIKIGGWFLMSVQASPEHACTPQAMLDPMAYEAFEVMLTTQGGVISYGKWGAWAKLAQKPWAARFRKEHSYLMVADNVPTAEVQQIFDDLTLFAKSTPLPS